MLDDDLLLDDTPFEDDSLLNFDMEQDLDKKYNMLDEINDMPFSVVTDEDLINENPEEEIYTKIEDHLETTAKTSEPIEEQNI